MQFDVIIIGAGPSGLFSAFQAGMLGMKSAIIDSLEITGGQCSALYPEKPIYDVPGYPQILAQDLINKLIDQSKPFKPEYFLSEQVVGLKNYNNFFKLITSSGKILQTKVVIIAAGAGAFGPNRPPLEGIELYEGRSVFYSVTHREYFTGKNIVIAGGGDSALDWAISLSELANVSIVHRRNKFSAIPGTIQKIYKLVDSKKIKLITNYQLDGLKGNNGILEEVSIVNLDNSKKIIKADILLPFFGLSQNLGPILDFGLNISKQYINVNYPYFETNIKGVYAIGDVAQYEGKLKLILTSFAESASALHHAYTRVSDGKHLHFEYSTTKGVKI